MSSYLSRRQVEKLLEPIHPGRVGKDGKGFSHVEAWEMRAVMNRLFGFARWSQEVLDQQLIFEQAEERSNGKFAWTVAYRSLVCVKICAPDDGEVLAVYTEGAVGDAQNQPVRADAHDLALKTSQSQAFKRAVTNLGDIAGLSLYNNGSLRPIVGQTFVMPPAIEQEKRAAVEPPEPDHDEPLDVHAGLPVEPPDRDYDEAAIQALADEGLIDAGTSNRQRLS